MKESHDLRIVSPDCASSLMGLLKIYRLLPYRHEVSTNRTCKGPTGLFFIRVRFVHIETGSVERDLNFVAKNESSFFSGQELCLKSIHQKYSTLSYHILDLIFSYSSFLYIK